MVFGTLLLKEDLVYSSCVLAYRLANMFWHPRKITDWHVAEYKYGASEYERDRTAHKHTEGQVAEVNLQLNILVVLNIHEFT